MAALRFPVKRASLATLHWISSRVCSSVPVRSKQYTLIMINLLMLHRQTEAYLLTVACYVANKIYTNLNINTRKKREKIAVIPLNFLISLNC